MAGLDPAIQPQDSKRWNLLSWMAASEGGHYNKGISNNFDTLQWLRSLRTAAKPPKAAKAPERRTL
jgi:hypothetical protein